MNTAWFPVFLICVVFLAITLVLFGFPRGFWTKAKTPADLAHTPNPFRDDDRYWYAGFCYDNPDDPALFVPKRFGGWTVNFGHPGGKLFLIVIVLVLLLSTVLLPVLTSGSAPPGCHSLGCTP